MLSFDVADSGLLDISVVTDLVNSVGSRNVLSCLDLLCLRYVLIHRCTCGLSHVEFW